MFLGLGVPPREDWVAGESVREGGMLGAALSPILRVLKGVVEVVVVRHEVKKV